MAREEEIREASNELSKFHPGIKAWIDMAFERGALWADNNPKSPWVDVHDKLPECGKEVVVTDGTYCHVNAWESSSSYTGWRYGAGRITHWCPIPSLPEKEDYDD